MKQVDKKNLSKEELKKLSEQLKQSELQSIFLETEALTPQQLKEKNKEKEKIKYQLQGGGTISEKEIKDYRASQKLPYKPHFGYDKPFYEEIYKKNWPTENYRKFVKRKEVAEWTLRLIYGRFPDGVLQYLKKQNPILFTYIRKHKYFQYLNQEGQNLLDEFIADFNRMIVGYDDWDKFEIDYCEKYKIRRQLKLV